MARAKARPDAVPRAVPKVVQEKNARGVVIGHPSHGRPHALLGRSTVHRLPRLARDVDVHVVADRA